MQHSTTNQVVVSLILFGTISLKKTTKKLQKNSKSVYGCEILNFLFTDNDKKGKASWSALIS